MQTLELMVEQREQQEKISYMLIPAEELFYFPVESFECNVRPPEKLAVTIEDIQRIVCKYFNTTVENIQTVTRKREIVQVRHIAMYFSKIYTEESLATIGSQIGNKDHASVIHAYKAVNNLIDTDKRFKSQINELKSQIKKLHNIH